MVPGAWLHSTSGTPLWSQETPQPWGAQVTGDPASGPPRGCHQRGRGARSPREAMSSARGTSPRSAARRATPCSPVTLYTSLETEERAQSQDRDPSDFLGRETYTSETKVLERHPSGYSGRQVGQAAVFTHGEAGRRLSVWGAQKGSWAAGPLPTQLCGSGPSFPSSGTSGHLSPHRGHGGSAHSPGHWKVPQPCHVPFPHHISR